MIFEEVVAGQGQLDIAANLRELHKLPQLVPYMLEYLHSEAEYDQAAAHVRAVARQEKVPL